MATSPATPHTPTPLADLASTAQFVFGGLVWGAVMLITLGFWLRAKYDSSSLIWANVVLCAGVAAAGLALWQAFTLWIQNAPAEQKSAALTGQQRIFSLVFMASGLALVVLAVILGVGKKGSGVSFIVDNIGESLGVLIFGLIALGAGFALSAPSAQSTGTLIQATTRAVPMLKLIVLVLGVGAAGTVGYLFYKKVEFAGWAPEFFGLISFSLLCLACFFWLNTGSFDEFGTRLFVLIFGGTAGLILFINTLGRVYLWRQDIFLGGTEAWQGENAWRFWVCAYVLFIALALIFASLNAARADIRFNVTLRRVLYGYDTLAQAFLLIGILFVFNVVIYARFPLTFDWTKSRGAYDLSVASKNLLSRLRVETNVVVLLTRNDPSYKDTRTLLDNCEAISNNKFKVTYMSPDIDQKGYVTLGRKFPQILPDPRMGGGRGVLIVYGPIPESDKHDVPYAFVPERRLHDVEDDPRRPKRIYKGESEIIRELKFLAQDRKKPKIYILQGDDELDVNLKIPSQRRDNRDGFELVGIGHWADLLRKETYDVAGLSFKEENAGQKKEPENMVYAKPEGAAKTKEVPDDCHTLVIAGAADIAPEAIGAIERYMDRSSKSKLFVFLDVATDREYSKLRDTGLEPLLKRFGVEVTNEFILHPLRNADDDPTLMLATPSTTSENPLARQFEDPILIRNTARVVRPLEPATKFKAETIWNVSPRINGFRIMFIEKDTRTLNDSVTYMKEMVKDVAKLKAANLTAEPISIAVAVTEAKGDTPRLVVFGDAEWISNLDMQRSPYRVTNTALAISALEWMAERESIGAQPKVSSSYTLQHLLPGDAQRMVFIPGFLMLLVLVGLGAGIWIVRRR